MDSISIIVPIFEGSKYVPFLIKMAERNFFRIKNSFDIKVELVLVNDCPNDKIISNWSSSSISVLLIENMKNEGIHQSRINGYKASHGKYVVFLDQDDFISENYLASQLKFLRDTDAVLCNAKEKGRVLYEKQILQPNQVILQQGMNGSNIIVSPGQVLIKRQAIPDYWLKHRMVHSGADDFFLWMLMIMNNCIFSYNHEVLYIHNVTGVNFSGNFEKMHNSVHEMMNLLVLGNYLTYGQIIKMKDIREAAHVKLMVNRNQMNYKDTCYLHLLDIWLDNVERGIRLESFFVYRMINNIAIYGMGLIGKHLIKELESTDVHVKNIIDEGNREGNISVAKIGDRLDNINAIVVTPFLEFKQIKAKLAMHYKCEILSIEEVIYMAEVWQWFGSIT